jgi:hypothetical protein
MSDRPIAGFECALFYKDGANWNEIKNAKDVSLPDSTEAIDVSARYSAAKKYIAGMSDGSIEFGYQYIKGTDPVFDALQARYLSREPIEIAAADGADRRERHGLFPRLVRRHQVRTDGRTGRLAGLQRHAATDRGLRERQHRRAVVPRRRQLRNARTPRLVLTLLLRAFGAFPHEYDSRPVHRRAQPHLAAGA